MGRSGGRRLLLSALLVLAVLAAYSPVADNGFVWDDDRYVTANPLLEDPDGLSRIWFSLDSPSQYFPLTYTVLRAGHALWGKDPLGYHLLNVGIHAVNALLLFRVLTVLSVPGAWPAAAVFALHPVQVESVAWISELKNVLSALFYLLALLAWLAFSRAGEGKRVKPYAASLGLFALALLSKTTAVTLPLVFLVIDWMRKRRLRWARLLEAAPFLLLSLGMGLLTMWWERFHQGTRGPEFAFGIPERILIAGKAVWVYLFKLVWPLNLSFSYPRWELDPSDPLQYAWPAACLAAALLLWLARRATGRGPAAAMAFFVVSLAPLLGFISLYTFRYAFVADHYQYVAAAGPIALASAGLAKLLDAQPAGARARVVVIPVILAILGTMTWRQARVYRDGETLWRHTIAVTPDAWIAHNNLGLILQAGGETEEAMASYRRALEIRPLTAETHVNIGNLLERENDIAGAVSHYRRAVEIAPGYPRARYNLALSLAEQGDAAAAAEHYREAIRAAPRWGEPRNNLGALLLSEGKAEEAAAEYRRAAELMPRSAEVRLNLAAALETLGRADEAAEAYRRATLLAPDDPRGHYRLGMLLARGGKTDQAVAHFNEVLRLDPDSFGAHNNLGSLLARRGEYGEALRHLEQAVRLNPSSAGARFNAGMVLARQGMADRALEQLEEALRLEPGHAAARDLREAILRSRKPE